MRLILFMLLVLGFAVNTWAADDPSIKGEKRTGIQEAMTEHIKANSVDGRYVLYDPIDDKVLKLKLDDLHDGIVQKSDYYVSCADFTSSTGTYYDLDFMVVEKDGKYKALQGFVHKVGKDKRKYHLENTPDGESGATAEPKTEEKSEGFFDRLFGK